MTGSSAATQSVRTRAFEMITRWNTMEQRLATLLANRKTFPETPSGLRDPRIVRVLIDRWEKLGPDDPRNLDFEAAASALHLDDEQRRLLKGAGATDLRSMARALKAARGIERLNTEVQRLRKVFKARKVPATPPELVEFAISPEKSINIRNAIAAELAKDRS